MSIGGNSAARLQLTLLFVTAAGQGPVAAEAAENARRWLTRLDRESIEAALKDYYARNVAFPESLRALSDHDHGLGGKVSDPSRPTEERIGREGLRTRNLPAAGGQEASDAAAGKLPLTDRWGRPWVYRLSGFKHFRALAGQRYTLESATLGAASDLGAALKIPYTSGLGLKATGFVTMDKGGAVAEFEPASGVGRRLTLMEGTTEGGLKCVRVAPRFILLSDGDRWAVLPRPAAGGTRP